MIPTIQRWGYLFVLTVAMLPMACTAPKARLARDYIAAHGIVDPRPAGFKFCYGHGCTRSAHVQLSRAQWQTVRQIFQPASTDAAMEKQRIIQAIALMERMVGKITGTDRDLGGTFPGTFRSGQLDCADEAINTSTYLTLMEDAGLIQFHAIYQPIARGYFIRGWPHFATVMIEKKTGTQYVIDSWFWDNGRPPHILPVAKWKRGWKPKKETRAPAVK